MQSVRVTIKETVWELSSFEGGSVGARGPDDPPPAASPAGIFFSGSNGERRFLEMDPPELPSPAALRKLTLEQFSDLLRRSRPI